MKDETMKEESGDSRGKKIRQTEWEVVLVENDDVAAKKTVHLRAAVGPGCFPA